MGASGMRRIEGGEGVLVWEHEGERKKTRGGASYEVMHSWRRTDLLRCAHFPTQMRPFPDAEDPSGQQRGNDVEILRLHKEDRETHLPEV